MKMRVIRLVAAFVLVFSSLPLLSYAAPPAPQGPAKDTTAAGIPKTDEAAIAKIEPQVFKDLEKTGRATYLVYLHEQADLRTAAATPDKLARRRGVVAALQETAARSQGDVITLLKSRQAAGQALTWQSFWIFNGLAVSGDESTLLALAARPAVAKIRANHVRHLTPTPEDSAALRAAMAGAAAAANSELGWNVAQVRADQVWSAFDITGQGMVLANMDTGVYMQHPALERKYRGYNNGAIDNNYNWFDATDTSPLAPVDDHGHGTHTMGTMVGSESNGDNQIGVAPGAQWIAVKIFDSQGNATDAGIHAGFQWLMAPTNLQGQSPDPSKAPDIVSNSWGDTNSSDQTFTPDVAAWRAAGIMPVFAAGNAGPGAGTVDAPGSSPLAFAVGATDMANGIGGFSGRGPSPWGEIKPEITAPGVGIRSSVPIAIDPSGYQGGWNGTSMATPHVAAATALLWQARPGLSITATEFLLTSTARPLPSPASVPNNDFGWGLLDIYSAVGAVVEGGRFWGRVTDQVSGAAVPAAAVTMTRQDGDGSVHTTTDASGYYTFTVAAGIYSVLAQDFWHWGDAVYGAVVTAGLTTIVDFQLRPFPLAILNGHVTNSETGAPLTATIQLPLTPLSISADAAGFYSVTLPVRFSGATPPVDYYSIRAVPRTGYRQGYASGVQVTGGMVTTQDFALASAPTILLVDADYWAGFSQISYYQNDLNQLLYTYDTRTVFSYTVDIPSTVFLQKYDVVVWHQPMASPGYVGAWPSLGGYLDGGGRLLITGQDIGYWDVQRAKDAMGYQTYLHATYNKDDVGSRAVAGVTGGLYSGITMTLNTADSAGNQQFPDDISPRDPAATTVISFTGTITPNSPAGLKIETPAYRAVYMAFGLEGAGPAAQRQETLNRTINWLTLPALTKSVDKALAAPGDTITYTLRLNNASSQAAGGLSITDVVPARTSYVAGSATGGLVYNSAQNRLQWTGAISPGDVLTFTFAVQLESTLQGNTTIANTAYLNNGSGVSLPAGASTVVGAPNLSRSAKRADPGEATSGQEITYTIYITNTGMAAADVAVSDPLPAGASYVASSASNGATYDAGANTVRWSGHLPPAGGVGADYTFTSSDDPGGPAFSWMDIITAGTRISAGDDTTHGPLAIGFTFPYYGATYSQFYLGANGWLSFVTPTGGAFSNICLPDPAALPIHLAPWWDDLNPTFGTGIYYWSNNVDTLVVSYIGIPRYTSGGPYTFQAILRANGDITYQYLDMGANLTQATIGLQNQTGTMGLSAACDQDYVHNQLALLFTPPNPPAVGADFSFRVRLNDGLPPQTTITNTALVTTTAGLSQTLSAAIHVNTIDLASSAKTAAKGTIGMGETQTYTVTVRNSGNMTGTATVTDTLPAELIYAAGSASNGTVYDASSRSVLWSGAVAPGGAAAISFGASFVPTLTDGTIVTNTAIIADGAGAAYSRSVATRYRTASLESSRKEVTPGAVAPGGTVTFTIFVVNDGGGPTPFTVTDTVPASFSVVSSTIEISHGAFTFDPATQQLVWSGAVPGLHQAFLRFTAQVQAGGALTNTAQIRDSTGHVIERSARLVVSKYRWFLPIIVSTYEWPAQ